MWRWDWSRRGARGQIGIPKTDTGLVPSSLSPPDCHPSRSCPRRGSSAGLCTVPTSPAPPGCCALRGRWHHDRHQTFPSLLFLPNFFRIAGAAQLAKAELRPLTAGFQPVRAPGRCRARVALGAQGAASHETLYRGSALTGDFGSDSGCFF